MTIDDQGLGGTTQSTGGVEDENQNKQLNKEIDEKPSTVAREAYDRAVSEAKKAKDELKKLRDAELLKNNEYQKLYEAEKKSREEIENEYKGLRSNIVEGTKLNAFMSKVNGKIDPEYWDKVDLEQIHYDPETKKVDEASVLRAVKAFEAKHSRLIDRPTQAKLPSEAAKGGGAPLTIEEWKKLPLDQKKARYADVFGKK